MNKRYKDTDLREALHRKYADTPQLPADFMAKMEQRMAERQAAPSGSAAGAKRVRLWRWVAAVASILLIIGIGLHVQFSDWTRPVAQSDTSNQSIEHAQSINRARSVAQSSTLNQSIEHAQSINRARSVAQSSTVNPSTDHGQSINRPRSIDQSTVVDSDPDLHYAAADLTKDTIPYQDPARVDDYIFQLADYHQVKQGQLTCSLPVDSSVVSSVYVFPDKDEINLFGRLLQVACWYDSKTPGYHLNFSQEQFFFELKDLRRQLQYRWVAERINGRILFYSTHAPLGVKESSACYQEYRDELMYQNSINHKTKEI
jgi:hypothetical protein